MKTIEVAIGIILQEGQVLIARRKADDSFGGYWEFPGGKIEAGESPDVALLRELTEELAITCAIDEALESFICDYPQTRITLRPFIVHPVSGDPQPLESDEIRWVAIADLHTYRFPPANQMMIDGLQRRFRISDPAN